MYCRLAQLIGNRKELSEESLPSLEEVVMDSAKAQAILDASRSSMGQYTVQFTSPYHTICPLFAHSGPIIVLGDQHRGAEEALS